MLTLLFTDSTVEEAVIVRPAVQTQSRKVNKSRFKKNSSCDIHGFYVGFGDTRRLRREEDVALRPARRRRAILPRAGVTWTVLS